MERTYRLSGFLAALFVIAVEASGEPLFNAGVNYNTGHSKDLVSADFDNDGDLDIAALNLDGSISILVNRGNGVFGPTGPYKISAAPHAITAADFDGDNNIDLAVTGLSGQLGYVFILKNDGHTEFSETDRIGPYSAPLAVASADLDKDGDVDIAFTNIEADIEKGGFISQVIALRNMWSETGGEFGEYFVEDGRVSVGDFPLDIYPRTLMVSDINHDTHKDLICVNGKSNDISFLPNGGNLQFVTEARIPVAASPNSLAVEDFDQDGDRDMAVAHAGTKELFIFLNSGNGTFPEPVRFDTGVFAHAMTVGDFDKDGLIDLVVAMNTGELVVLRNKGAAHFETLSPRYPAASLPKAIVSADFNKDGNADLAVATPGVNEGVGVFLHASVPSPFIRGDADLSGTVDIGDPVYILKYLFRNGPEPSCLDTAEVNGDGSIDISDPIYLLLYLFDGGSAPSPEPLSCAGGGGGIPVENGVTPQQFAALAQFPGGDSLQKIVGAPSSAALATLAPGQVALTNNLYRPALGQPVNIHYHPRVNGHVTMKLYTTSGEFVKTILDADRQAQDATETWSGTNQDNQAVASGIYLLHVQGPGIKATKKIAVVK